MSDRFRIATYNAISHKGLERLPGTLYDVGKGLSAPDAILLRSHQLAASEVAPSVKAIARAGAGVNNIPVELASKRGVPVFNAPGANANAVKELVLAGMLLAARNLVPAVHHVQALRDSGGDFEKRVEEGKKQFAGVELMGKTLGVIGLGAIGGLVAEMAEHLGMRVVGFDPQLTLERARQLPRAMALAADIGDVLKQSDFVTLHVPLADETRGLIDATRLAAARKGAVLLNFSRDAVVDESAVLLALADTRLRYYVCDFPTPALQGHANVIALPHLGASTEEAEENCAVMVVDQLRDYLEHGNIRNAVNFPTVKLLRESPYRIAIANANVPNMLGQISTAFAQAGLNIHDMVNKSKGDMAYTLVDLDADASDALLERIAHIEGVLSVRRVPVWNDRL